MDYVIAVFKSRTQVMKFYDKLQNARIPSDIVNTPREASLGCGLSVKFNKQDFVYVQNILRRDYYHSFGGFFNIREQGHHKTVNKIQNNFF